MKNFFKKLRLIIPIPSAVFFILALLSVGVHIFSMKSQAFADFFNMNVSSHIRAFTAHLTGGIPFSLAETIVLSSPLILALLIMVCVKVACVNDTGGKKYASARYLVSLFSVAALEYSLFVCSFGAAYNSTTLDRKLGLERRDVSAEELYKSAEYMLSQCDTVLDEVTFAYGAESIMPYTLDEMVDLLNIAYGRAADKYDFIPKLDENVKFIMASEPMTYTHISGVYTFFTGEANLNINFPEYSLPFTAAHEMSHQRGIARENEANFMAFLVCIESGDPYIRYSGYVNMYEYLANALYSANPDMYFELLATVDKRVYGEIRAYSRFFDKYRESVASDVSGAVNDTYLKLQGQSAGTKSYGLVVDLAVAYVHDVMGN